MDIEKINIAAQLVADKTEAFDLALKTENHNKIKFAATELSNAKVALEAAKKLSPSENLEALYKKIKALREEGKTYEAMELSYNGRK